MILTRASFHRDLSWIDEVNLSGLSPAYSTANGAVFQIDALRLLSKLPSNSVDLVMTSPRFALARKKEYGNEPIDKYLQWFMPFCREVSAS